MANVHRPGDPVSHDENAAEQTPDEWIDETMAAGDIANGEGDPESQPERGSEE